jgi:hypothetical protein
MIVWYSKNTPLTIIKKMGIHLGKKGSGHSGRIVSGRPIKGECILIVNSFISRINKNNIKLNIANKNLYIDLKFDIRTGSVYNMPDKNNII